MILSSQKNCNYLLAGVLIIAHLATCLLGPWFHQHPGQDHAEAKGGSHHTHASPSAPLASEHEEDDDHEDAILHLFTVGNPSLELLRGASPAHSENSVAAVVMIVVDWLVAAIPNPTLSRQGFFQSPILSNPQDYCVLSATNLSPPQA